MEINSGEIATLKVVEQFNAAFNRQDVIAIMELMTPDCIFGEPYPPPDGSMYEGQEAVRAYWERFFAESPLANFTFYDLFASTDRAVVRWTYHWVEKDGKKGHIQGVDVLRVRDGQIAEKFSYVKG